MRHGNGYSNTAGAATPILSKNQAYGIPAAGARKPEPADSEQPTGLRRGLGRPPLTADAANFLHDGSGVVEPAPASPSVFSSRAKNVPMAQYSVASTQKSVLQQSNKVPPSPQPSQPVAMPQYAQPNMPQYHHQQQESRSQQSQQSQPQRWATSAQAQRSQPSQSPLLSGDFTVTDLTDPGPPSSAPTAATASVSAPPPASVGVARSLEPEGPPEPQPQLPPPAAPIPEMAPAPAPEPPLPIDPKEAALGAGVFAKVRMTHGRDGQIVAVKTYNHKEAREEKAVAKHMLNEERLAGKLQHEHIIAPQLARKGPGVTELEMEYAPGGTLEAFVKSLGRPFTEEEARRLFRQLVDAVRYLHEEKGICHRDIKMENVVLDADGNARIVDFGAAKEGGAHSFLTSMQGTPAYMAPEIAQLRAHKGGPADVWALGVLLYNLLTGGAFPFWGKSMDELKRNITAAPPKLPAHLSPSCKDLLTKLLQKSSAIRSSILEIVRHPWLAEADAPGAERLPVLPRAAASGHPKPASAAQQHVNAAIAADAAAAANAYRGELAAARIQQHGIPLPQRAPPPASSPRAGHGPPQPHAQAAAAAASPRMRGDGMYQNAYYQNYSRNPITGMPTPGVDSRPSTAGSSPRSQSKLAGLMNADRARPGTACGGLGRAASEAQLNGYRRR